MRAAVGAVLIVAAFAVLAPASDTGASVARFDVPASAGSLRPAVRLNPPASGSPVTDEVLDLVNGERARRGLSPMTIESRLMTAAQRHSEDQAQRRHMSHVGSDGSQLRDRVNRVGYNWRSIAENVAYGYPTPAAVMAAWMGSSGHRANILSSNVHIGIGLAYGSNGLPYWTQVFAAPR